MKHFIEGKNIYLRGLTKSDIPKWFNWFNDPIITEHMNKGVFPNSELLQEEFMNHILKSKNDLQLGIVLKENDTLIGIVGVHKIDWIHRNGDVSVVLGEKEYWGKGIAREAIALVVRHAFTKMNLRRLTAGMSILNTGSQKCFESNEFVLEGTRRKHFFHNGKYLDVLMFGLLREEWEQEIRD